MSANVEGMKKNDESLETFMAAHVSDTAPNKYPCGSYIPKRVPPEKYLKAYVVAMATRGNPI